MAVSLVTSTTTTIKTTETTVVVVFDENVHATGVIPTVDVVDTAEAVISPSPTTTTLAMGTMNRGFLSASLNSTATETTVRMPAASSSMFAQMSEGRKEKSTLTWMGVGIGAVGVLMCFC